MEVNEKYFPNIADAIIAKLSEDPEKTVFCYKDRFISNRELHHLISQFKELLIKNDLKQNQHVAILLDNSPEFIAALIACLHLRIVCVPINCKYNLETMSYIILHANIDYIITIKKYMKNINFPKFFNIDDNNLPAAKDYISRYNEANMKIITNDLAIILYTSGSTGKPKGVMISHQNLSLGVDSVVSFLPFKHELRIAAMLPMSFDAGLNFVLSAIFSGSITYFLTYLLPNSLVKQLIFYKIQGVLNIPYIYKSLAQNINHIMPHMEFMASTGGVMNVDIVKSLNSNMPNNKFYIMYGLTEAFRSTYLLPSLLDKKLGSIGKAIPHSNIYIIRNNGIEEAGVDEIGEIVHCGPLVSLGYWNDKKKTDLRYKLISKNIYKLADKYPIAVFSGDLGKKDQDGFIYFIGRKDTMIKSRGFRIAPSEIENTLTSVLNITNAYVFGINNDLLGQEIIAVIEGKTYFGKSSMEIKRQISTDLKGKLSSFMIPDRYFFIDQFPLNSNGKIDGKKIYEMLKL